MSSGGATAVLFPGQGAQSVGMAGDWCVVNRTAADLFARAAEILGYDLLAICRDGPADRLNTTAVSQPGILVTSLAALAVLRERAPALLKAATVTAGLSLGEYTALVFAGVLSFDDAVRLVDIRGRAMQACADQRPGGMVAVLGLEREQVEAVCSEARESDVLAVANVLCPGNIVVSGSVKACRRAETAAIAAGAMKCVPLDVAGAFHTQLMEPAVEKLRAALATVSLATPRIPVVSNVDARPHTDPEEIRALLARQVCGVVEWQASMEQVLSTGVQAVWEVGPGRVLRGLLKRIRRGMACHGVFD
ncbi:MAG: ACP S-malonyltransferase [Planctomycetota bacterium]|nr:ACP S-malonyltransferase [Planctomycetota bacterium]